LSRYMLDCRAATASNPAGWYDEKKHSVRIDQAPDQAMDRRWAIVGRARDIRHGYNTSPRRARSRDNGPLQPPVKIDIVAA